MQGDKISLLSVRSPPNRPALDVRVRTLFLAEYAHAQMRKSLFVFVTACSHLTSPAPLQSLGYQKAKESLPIFCDLASLLIPRDLLQSSFAPQPIKSPPYHTTYAVPIVPERLCSLCMSKSGKVFAYSFALAVFIVSKYLCILHTLRQP